MLHLDGCYWYKCLGFHTRNRSFGAAANPVMVTGIVTKKVLAMTASKSLENMSTKLVAAAVLVVLQTYCHYKLQLVLQLEPHVDIARTEQESRHAHSGKGAVVRHVWCKEVDRRN